jgi:hypothetical protein
MTLTAQRMQGIPGALKQQQQQQQQAYATASSNGGQLMPPSATAAAAVAAVSSAACSGAGSGGQPGRQPLLTGCSDSLTRVRAILQAMSGDLLGRVMLDR